MNLPSPGLRHFRSLPKADLHNHCLLGGQRKVIERFYGKKLAPFKASVPGIHALNQWIAQEFRPFMQRPGAFEKAVEAAFIQAKSDGVTRLEMSIDVYAGNLFRISPAQMAETLQYYHRTVAPDIAFIPEVGFARSMSIRMLLKAFEPFLELGYFRSIDLYDDEFAQPVMNFREIYRFARNQGFRCKAHAGEFGTAESVREAVEVLELDAVQHGIAAADSPEVMRFLADRKIILNVCPASNIRLKRVRSYRTHPIRRLFDHGVRVTINTDDALIFGTGISAQLLKFYRLGLFSIDELDEIRMNGLHA